MSLINLHHTIQNPESANGVGRCNVCQTTPILADRIITVLARFQLEFSAVLVKMHGDLGAVYGTFLPVGEGLKSPHLKPSLPCRRTSIYQTNAVNHNMFAGLASRRFTDRSI